MRLLALLTLLYVVTLGGLALATLTPGFGLLALGAWAGSLVVLYQDCRAANERGFHATSARVITAIGVVGWVLWIPAYILTRLQRRDAWAE